MVSILIVNPYWQILEKSSRNFPEILIRSPAGPIFGKFIHQFFVSTFSVFEEYRGMSYTDLWTNFPEIGLAHVPNLNKTE